MDELWRISKNGAIFKINVPYFSYCGAFQDPTHKRFFTLKTFYYFTNESKLPHYAKSRFKIIKEHLNLFPSRPNLKFLDLIVNYHQRFYEKFFSYILPCEELEIILKVIK